ncbi:carboxypeptidase-like regulatory domain-containing protein [Shivajiella indica]|uniref:Carboxypeptidase-like regulatory domain-containing protein n=1 Tax=Shivajiella indica TaxID=872115 RepID=A0ABW5BAG3_9BACT
MKIKKSNLLILSTFFLGVCQVHAQFLMRGKVLDAESLQPLEFATVFINNSTFGDITDRNGAFQINVPAGNYELVISYLGYQTFSFPFNTNTIRDSYEFRILPEFFELEEARIAEKRDKAWYNNLEIFKENFLGTSINGQRCKILNPEVLILDNETNKNVLTAKSKGILEIENPNLGYSIKYVLEGFELDFENKVSKYAGYPYFIEKDIPRRRKAQIEKQRIRAFEGSITHFVRVLYQGNIEEEGFVVKKSEIKNNRERPSDAEIEVAKEQLAQTRTWLVRDSLRQFIQKENLPKERFELSEEDLSVDNLVEEARNGWLFLTYSDPFFVIFEKEHEEPNFRKYSAKQSDTNQIRGKSVGIHAKLDPMPFQVTQLTLTGNALRIFEDGSYFHPFDLYLNGYMAWEKIGDLMPFDYKMSD